LQSEFDAASTSRDDVSASAKELEKKYKALETDLIHTQQDLLASERARKDLQADKEEMAEEMHTASRFQLSLLC